MSRAGSEARATEDDGSRVALLEPALWKRLVDAADIRELATAWLELQSGMLGGASRATVVILPELSAADAARFTAGADPAMFATVIDAAMAQRRGVVQRVEAGGTDGHASHLAFPLLIDGELRGVVAVECAMPDEAGLRAAMRQLQWGVAWLRERLRADREAGSRREGDRSQAVLDFLAATLNEESFVAAGRALVTELALQLACERVSLGWFARGRSQVTAISHSAQFGKQMNLVRLLAEAMDEAVDQQATLAYPAPPDEPHVTRAHEELARGHGAAAILTVPLFVRDRFVGALTCERREPLDEGMVRLVDALAAAAAPVLEDKRLNDRWLIVKLAAALAEQTVRLVGPGYVVRKLAAVALIALTAAGYAATGTYRVTADAVIEGEIQRSIVATFNGFIKEAPARPGDAVRTGAVLATLDDRELVLERLKWVTDRQKHTLEYDKALGERNRADLRIVQTQIEQDDAQIRLVDEQLARSRLAAPFDGIVVSGDLTQSVGAAVQRGQVLFEIAPLDRYRVVLEVDESQIGDVADGRRGELVVSSLPGEAFAIVVSKITPIARAHDGRNFFRVEARVDGSSAALRPGMRGVAKLDVDRRRLVWIWSRSFIDWGRLFAWRWFG